MAAPSLTYTLTNGNSADASQLMQDLNDLLNGITDGSKDLSINALTAAGTATFNGNVALGNATSDTVTYTGRVASTIAPTTTLTYDLGTSALAWQTLYAKTGSFGATSSANVVSLSTSAADSNCSLVMSNDARTYSLTVRGDSSDNLELIDSNAGVSRLILTSAGLATWNSTIDGTTAFTINAGGTNIDATSDVVLSLQFNGDADPSLARYVQFGRSGNAAIGSISAATASTVAYNTSSDTRLKLNQRPIEYGLATIHALEAKHYEWKDDGKTDFGLIAQEVVQVVPECVRVPEDPEDIWSMEYAKLVPILVRAVQELAERVYTLEGRAA